MFYVDPCVLSFLCTNMVHVQSAIQKPKGIGSYFPCKQMKVTLFQTGHFTSAVQPPKHPHEYSPVCPTADLQHFGQKKKYSALQRIETDSSVKHVRLLTGTQGN